MNKPGRPRSTKCGVSDLEVVGNSLIPSGAAGNISKSSYFSA